MGVVCDFSGWATRNDIKCSDGRTIRRDAFKENDGQTVPLVWMHQHNAVNNVLGHALLENRDEGVYAYGTFNDTEEGRAAKELVKHGDITSLSIYANQLKQNGGDVFHGNIREVSLVLAGANAGAMIESVNIVHSDDGDVEEAIVHPGVTGLTIQHEDSEGDGGNDAKETTNMANENKEKTVQDVFNELTEEQKNVVYFMIGKALEDQGGDDDDTEEKDDEEVKHNVFEQDTGATALSHADYESIFANAKRLGSLKDAVEAFEADNGTLVHTDGDVESTAGLTPKATYGVQGIGTLFPEYHNLNNPPEFIKRNTDWVSVVMNGVHHTPFSRIKSQFADLREDEARALGYIKGHLKKEEVFTLLKRTTDPQTIYKKQKLDRDDMIDITDFDVVAWIKGEMRMMRGEEIARAILLGDGRLPSSDDKIQEAHIRPIWNDADLFTLKAVVTPGADADATAKAVIRKAVKMRKDYRGSGNLTCFTSEDRLADMLLLEDQIGHALYPDEGALARKLRVNRIVTVPLMENMTDGNGNEIAMIIVDLKDYNVGADRGGAVNMFDDFDIDYNQQKYLIETRCSGAMIKPFAAMVVKVAAAGNSGNTDPVDPDNP